MKQLKCNQIHTGLSDSGVSDLVEYFIITSILMLLTIITFLSVIPVAIENPTTQLTEYAFIDVGNGVSTRIVDLYIVAPEYGNMTTDFDIPDDIVGRGYIVEMGGEEGAMVVSVSRDTIVRNVTIAGIAQTVGVGGSTTGQGLNEICYDSEGNCA